MANFDTRQKRFSGMGLAAADPPLLPAPDAALLAGDRKHLLDLYSFGGATFQTVTGTLSLSGALTRQLAAKKTLTATLRFQGVVGGMVGKRISATLSFAGALTRRTSRALAGTLSFTGTLGRLKSVSKALAGALSFQGALTMVKSAGKVLAGVLSFQGGLSRRITRSLSGVLSFQGALSRGAAFNRALAGVLSFASTLGRVLIPAGFFKALTGILSFGPSTLTTEYIDNPEPEPGADSWLLRMRRRWGGK